MGKKKKSKKITPAKSSNTTKNIIIGILAVLVTALVAVAYQYKSAPETSPAAVVDENSYRRGETRETLSPSLFSDPYIARTYQIAKEIPHVLDSLFCYCYCDKDPFYHVSLLSCYVDKHAAG
jgi:hypothetical protein